MPEAAKFCLCSFNTQSPKLARLGSVTGLDIVCK